jgi:hypothetical protein
MLDQFCGKAIYITIIQPTFMVALGLNLCSAPLDAPHIGHIQLWMYVWIPHCVPELSTFPHRQPALPLMLGLHRVRWPTKSCLIVLISVVLLSFEIDVFRFIFSKHNLLISMYAIIKQKEGLGVHLQPLMSMGVSQRKVWSPHHMHLCCWNVKNSCVKPLQHMD